MVSKAKNDKFTFNVVPLRKMMMAPRIATPILVGRDKTVFAVKDAIEQNDPIICLPQKDSFDDMDYPTSKDVYRYGTMTMIIKEFPLPDGSMRLLCDGAARVKVKRFISNNNCLRAIVEICDKFYNDKDPEVVSSLEAHTRILKRVFGEYSKMNRQTPDELEQTVERIEDTDELFYFCLNFFDIDMKIKQELFEEDNLLTSIKMLIDVINKELHMIKLERGIENKVRMNISKVQREFFLNEQLKQIHKELGIADDAGSDLSKLKKLIKETNLSEHAREKVEEEFKKLGRINPNSQEYTVLLNYINWVLELPWDAKDTGNIDIIKSEEILNRDHYGLKDAKERILEHISVMQINQSIKGQIICFAGPPGVGKTSLGKSIAESLGREFVRISLGGVRDESEVRGHRRTYVGAIPGIIMQSLKKAKSTNPLIMMDEIDKLSSDFRGDPASALLEVLDPEQNSHFRDHYIDIEYDLSNVVFITTANDLSSIPGPLLDRMEIIEIPGYTEYEKVKIATNHLVPKEIKEHGIDKKIKVKFSDEIIHKIIKSYTREAGVRTLDRTIAKVIRKVIKEHLQGKIKKSVTLTNKHIKRYLGVERYSHSETNKNDRVGIVNGLAWTAVGGETMTIEIVKLPGDGKVSLTGQLGDVMKESAQAAISFCRLHAEEYGIDPDFYKDVDLHLHIPEGAVPKDGPSAGVTMSTAIVSILSDTKVRHDIAMTGEITLSGDVLPIGGLPEKLIAAKREGIKQVLIPNKNVKDLEEISDEIKTGLVITPVSTIEEVLKLALVK
jgi:ATP-dependent Lon protease